MEPVVWLVLLCVLLLIEVITLGLTTIWFAAGALVAFLVSLIGIALPIQIALFTVVSLVLLFFTRPIAVKYLNKDRVATNSDRYVGFEAKVIETIDNLNDKGQVMIAGQEWTARSLDDKIIEQGAIVIVKEIRGVKAIVDLK